MFDGLTSDPSALTPQGDRDTLQFAVEPPSTEPRPAPPEWLAPVTRQIVEFTTLQTNWDSYGARPPDPEALMCMVSLLRELAARHPSLQRPHVAPTTTRGVQAEWEADNLCASLEVRPGSWVSVYIDDGEREVELESDLTALTTALAKLTHTPTR